MQTKVSDLSFLGIKIILIWDKFGYLGKFSSLLENPYVTDRLKNSCIWPMEDLEVVVLLWIKVMQFKVLNKSAEEYCEAKEAGSCYYHTA